MFPDLVSAIFEPPRVQQPRSVVSVEPPKGRIDGSLGLDPAMVMFEEGEFGLGLPGN
jgi:hypothetical protein